jgi:hypothetical protein
MRAMLAAATNIAMGATIPFMEHGQMPLNQFDHRDAFRQSDLVRRSAVMVSFRAASA